MEETEKFKSKLPHQEIDYFKIAKIFLSRWYWIAGSVIICMIISNVYLWYTPKTYQTSSSLKLEDKKSAIQDISSTIAPAVERGPSKVQSETIVLQSNALLLNAIKQLDYRISFSIVGRLLNRTSDLYPQKPLDIELVSFDSLNFYRRLMIYKPVNKTTFSLTYFVGSKQATKNYQYNFPLTIEQTSFSIKYPGDLPKTASYIFKFNGPEDYVDRVRRGLHVGEVSKNSNILALQEVDASPQFAADVLNAIMKEYLSYDKNQRRQSASQMIDFIDSQLDFLAKEVKQSGNSIEEYKHKSNILDVSSAMDIAVSKSKEFDTQTNLFRIQLIAIDQLKRDIIKEKDNVTINFNIADMMEAQLGVVLAQLNTLIDERVTLLKTYRSDAQPIKDVDQQILVAKNSALNSIEASRRLVQSKMKYLADQLIPINKQIASLPSEERDLLSLKRDFDTYDKVYSFLSEKKLDAEITSAGILPGATIVDTAQPNFNPVSPDENAIHHSATIFGLLIGFGIIILIRVVNPYIYDKETIESLTTVPIIGVIRRFPDEIDEFSTQILAISKPKSVFAESVRSVRTNLSYLASEKQNKVICITSEVAGEGKSFVAVNLSSTMSLIDKKVILIAADLRRSKLHKTFHQPNDIGLSNYLAHQCTLDDIIIQSAQKNLHFILSGAIPPNPSELLHTTRMTDMVNELKLRYDVVMIDTAPIGLVSDAIPLIRMSDINVFVIRSGKSKFYAATVPQRIALEYSLDNTVIVLNAYAEDLLHSRYYTTKFTGDNHGSRYYYYSDYSGYESSGYYVDQKNHKWWDIRRFFK